MEYYCSTGCEIPLSANLYPAHTHTHTLHVHRELWSIVLHYIMFIRAVRTIEESVDNLQLIWSCGWWWLMDHHETLEPALCYNTHQLNKLWEPDMHVQVCGVCTHACTCNWEPDMHVLVCGVCTHACTCNWEPDMHVLVCGVCIHACTCIVQL